MNSLKVLDHSIMINLPQEFIEMSDEEVSKTNNFTSKMDYVFQDKSKEAYIGIVAKQLNSQDMVNVTIDDILNSYNYTYKRVVPNYDHVSMGKREIDGKMFGGLQYSSTTLNKDLINMLFITIIDNVEYCFFIYFEAKYFADLYLKLKQSIETMQIK